MDHFHDINWTQLWLFVLLLVFVTPKPVQALLLCALGLPVVNCKNFAILLVYGIKHNEFWGSVALSHGNFLSRSFYAACKFLENAPALVNIIKRLVPAAALVNELPEWKPSFVWTDLLTKQFFASLFSTKDDLQQIRVAINEAKECLHFIIFLLSFALFVLAVKRAFFAPAPTPSSPLEELKGPLSAINRTLATLMSRDHTAILNKIITQLADLAPRDFTSSFDTVISKLDTLESRNYAALLDKIISQLAELMPRDYAGCFEAISKKLDSMQSTLGSRDYGATLEKIIRQLATLTSRDYTGFFDAMSDQLATLESRDYTALLDNIISQLTGLQPMDHAQSFEAIDAKLEALQSRDDAATVDDINNALARIIAWIEIKEKEEANRCPLCQNVGHKAEECFRCSGCKNTKSKGCPRFCEVQRWAKDGRGQPKEQQ
ncbi:MAG: hypothetical protein Q9159_001448 [Coniocarpon cinnabarinum]